MDIATGMQKVRRIVASLSLATMLLGMTAVNVAQAAINFTDVPSDAWYYTFVDQLATDGVLDTTKTTYRPGDKANRAEAAKILVEAAGLTVETPSTASFKDVASGAWYYKYVETAAKNGIVGGYKDAAGNLTGEFRPTANINRAEFGKMASLAFSLAEKSVDGHSFPDVAADHWAHGYIETLYYWSVVDGYADGTFGPAKNINRAELAKFVVNAKNPVERAGSTPTPTPTPTPPVDSTKLNLSSATAASATSVTLVFDKAVDATAGATAANYAVKDDKAATLAVSAAKVETDGKTVTLTTASQTAGAKYTVTVSNLTSGDSGKSALGVATANFNAFGTVVQTGGALTVAMDTATPASTTVLATKTANNTMLVLALTAGSKDAQVTSLTLTKTGIYNDSSIKAIAYDANGKRLSSGVTFSSGTAPLSMTTALTVAAGSTVKVYLKANITGAASGTLGLSVAKSTDVASNSTSVSGTFPIASPNYSVVDGTPSVAIVTADVSSIASTARTVDIGSTAYQLTKFKFAETSSKEDVQLKMLTVFNNGSTADGDLKNFVLLDQSGNVLAKVADQKDKMVTFDLSASPYLLLKGTNRTLTVNVDIVNGATRNAQMIIQNDFDVVLTGATTGASLLVTADSVGTDTSLPIGDILTGVQGFNQISINQGSLTISKANASPSGDITLGATDAVLGSFQLQSAGEDIELQKIMIDLGSNQATGVSTAAQNTTGTMECNSSACDLVGNIKVQIDENGDGVGDKTLLSTSTQPTLLNDLWTNASLASYDLSNFYTVPAGKSVNLLIVGSITSVTTSTATGETIKVGIRNLYHYLKASTKYVTGANGSGNFVQANTLTVSTSTLTVSSNSAYGAQTIVGQTALKVGSFVVKAGSAEGVDITSITLKGASACAGSTVAATGYTNLTLKTTDAAGKTTQLGTPKATVTFDGIPTTIGTTGTANTFSFNNLSLAAGAQQVVDVYADVASVATNLCLDLGQNTIVGTGKVSITTVQGPASATDLQLMIVASNGNLFVSVASSTPIAQTFTAGTTGSQVLLLQMSASSAEDIYLTRMQFSEDATADDVAISQATIKVGTTSTALTTAGTPLTWVAGASLTPGSVQWTFSGAQRPMVPKNGTLYVGLYVDWTSSSQQAVSNKTPLFFLSDLQASGLNKLSATSLTQVTGTTTLAIATGIIPTAGAAATVGTSCTNATANCTFVTSAETTSGAQTATTATIVTANGQAFVPGDIIFVDQDDGAGGASDTKWTSATEELMVVLNDAGANLTVVRGAFGTTAQAYTTLKTIFVLNTGLTSTNGLVGNAMTIFNTRPTFSVATDTPTGASTGATGAPIFKFNVAADNNTADPAVNKVVLTSISVTTTKSGLTVANLKMYPVAPSNYDNNSTYATSCLALSQTKWLCTLNTTSATNEVLEGTTNTYSVRADIGSGAGTANTLTTSIATLGSAAAAGGATAGTAGDVVWTDAVVTTGSINWVYQAGATFIQPASSITLGASSGTTDATRPVVSSIRQINGTGTGNTLNSIDSDITCTGTTSLVTLVCDSATIVFSEAIDPTSILATLTPAGTVSGSGDTLTITSPAGVSIANSGTGFITTSGGTAVITYTNIATNTMTAGAAFTSPTAIVALDSLGTTLKIYNVKSAADQTVGASTAAAGVDGATGGIKDISGNNLNTTAPTVTGQF